MRALIHLALQPAGTRLSQVDLAAAIDAPAPFVGKVMQQLALAQLVTSQRGIGGGFALRLAAADVTMLDAVTAIEGPLALNTCLSPDEPCRRSSFCPAHHVWREVQERVTAALGAATIGALAAQMTPDTDGTGAAVGSAPEHRHEAGNDADDARERVVRSARPHFRGEDGLPARHRGRDASSVAGRAQGAGKCLR